MQTIAEMFLLRLLRLTARHHDRLVEDKRGWQFVLQRIVPTGTHEGTDPAMSRLKPERLR